MIYTLLSIYFSFLYFTLGINVNIMLHSRGLMSTLTKLTARQASGKRRVNNVNKSEMRFLREHRACTEAVDWLKANKIKSLSEAWEKCERSDWMLWLMAEYGIKDDRNYRLFACWCVRQVWHLLKDERSKKAVEVAEKYACGEATKEELSAAADSAHSAAARKNQADKLRAMFGSWDDILKPKG